MLIPGSYKGGFWTAGQLAIQPRLAYAAGVVNGLAPLFWSYAGTRALLAGSASATTATLATSVLGVAAATNNMTGMGFASSDQVMFFPGASGSVSLVMMMVTATISGLPSAKLPRLYQHR